MPVFRKLLSWFIDPVNRRCGGEYNKRSSKKRELNEIYKTLSWTIVFFRFLLLAFFFNFFFGTVFPHDLSVWLSVKEHSIREHFLISTHFISLSVCRLLCFFLICKRISFMNIFCEIKMWLHTWWKVS